MADTPLPTGDDGFTPVRDTSSLWITRAKKDTWLGQLASGKYILKIDDYMEDTDFHITYKCIGHDARWVPTLVRVTPKVVADLDSEDLLLGQTRDAYRVLVDKKVIPHRLQVDARCYVNARNAATARVYRGNPVNGAEEIVSLVLDQAGLPIGTLIPLEKTVIPNGENVAQYYVPTAYTNADIKNGEFLWVVLYDTSGAPLSSKALRATLASFTTGTDMSIKAVTGIALEGPLMSKLVPNRMEVPLNLTLNSMNMIGVVSYNSGEPKRANVDGTRFTLLGMNTFVPSQAGQRFPMKLRYALASGEASFTGEEISASRFVIEDIDVVVVDVENQLSVKLLPYPVWIDSASGYRLRWFLCNLDRNVMYDVSTLVETGNGSPVLDPTLYGVKQNLTVAIDLSKVNASWRAYRHVQTVGLTLLRRGDLAGDKWRIAFDPNQNPEYGTGLEIQARFINQNLTEVNLKSGFNTYEEWLKAFYYNTRPLINPRIETEPPVPAFFTFGDGTGQNFIQLSLADYWNRTFSVNFLVPDASTWYLHFYRGSMQESLTLSIAGAPVKQVLSF